jgi:regulator of replication initiation timing
MATWKQFATCTLGAILIAAAPSIVHAQTSPDVPTASATDLMRELKSQVAELQAAIKELREESTRYRAETRELRSELRSALAQVRPVRETAQTSQLQRTGSDAVFAANQPLDAEDRLARMEERYDLLSGKIDEQYQTKVESGSKYRVRLSGLALFNLFSNRGAVDNLDVPAIALSNTGRAEGSFGGTMRQSQIGLEVFGPTWAGARVRGNLQLDFGGGFPDTQNGVTMGLMRLRTATVQMDWPRTSVIGGQDAPFFSPRSPTSLASLAEPALAYAGNLWTWVPQLRIEHRMNAGENSRITVQAGILDPLTGERPAYQFERVPQAGEASRQPGYAARLAWSSRDQDRPASIGVGGYYNRQNWAPGRTVDGWAATADWSVPLGRMFSVTGEFYRGRAIGGLGGALGGTVLYTGPALNPYSRVRGLDAVGGWAQLKLRATPKLEFNLAGGQDNPYSTQLRGALFRGYILDYDAARNRSIFTNFIYRPRSDLLFSAEYRRIESFSLTYDGRSADHINLMMGVLF